MWNLISCYLSGQHDYQVRCQPGAIYLGCRHCGKRTMGWELRAEAATLQQVPVTRSAPVRAHAHAHATR